jgi:DNA invertase Pin-like site-specific DNA recombinase
MFENQVRELRQVAERACWQVVTEFDDNGISGAKGRDKRPALDAMLKAVTRREFDLVMAWSVDRLGRSLQHLVGLLEELHAAGVDLYLHQQGLDTATPAGRAMFQAMGVFAEFERAMIRERVKSGLEQAKAQGKQLGRRRIPAAEESRIRELRDQGVGIQRIAKQVADSGQLFENSRRVERLEGIAPDGTQPG